MLTSILYRLYERRLLAELRGAPLPRHIGLILDGDRRFARRRGLRDVLQGHERGAAKLEEALDWFEELGIRMVTIWFLSTENLTRPQEELERLLSLIERKMREAAVDPKIHRRQVRIRAIGQLDLLPPSLRDAIRIAEEATAIYENFSLNVAVGYGGRQEVADAVRGLLRDWGRQGLTLGEIADRLTADVIGKYLYTYDLPDPDLIIRTSGEVRLSGFLLWQSAYSEYYFCDAYWPAFRKIDLLRAIRSYQQRQRRFGR
ncbi:MAG: UDP pyrophosphate synthase [candidate division NC10 bacterium RIFCSPLOWO2_12_FULL_66_18]|nr:MAG: UDP pyrophosphate synthase [candidate division NC10 bacterium RIFCSPLOWO2_02_FULL_66_22]OGC02106.1 MAG: UDP pyrophosphate synthase [candidate division NC10 bacterium RIFCSPLOWO2_12_FULL_66_18]